MNVSAVKF